MKHLYLSTSLLLAGTTLFAQNGEIQNGGFENWTQTQIYEYPTQWQNSNQQEYGGVETVVKSTDAQSGTYSCELKATEVNGDTLRGYVFHGSVGSSGPDGGIAYTDNFDEVQVQYKGNLNNDTLYALVIRFNSGIPTSMESAMISTGNTANWTLGSGSISVGVQDELFVGFILNDPFNGVKPDPTSFVMIDEVHLFNNSTQTTDVPDPGFEDWTAQNVEDPDNWYTLNPIFATLGLNNANKSIDANSGNYSIELTTVEDPNGDTIPGFVSIGMIDVNAPTPFMPIPYNATPTTFSGSYKYAPANGDQGGIQIIFYNSGSIVGMHSEPFTTASTWTNFTSPLTLTQPDSLVLLISSGDNAGSVLKVDDLSFSGGDVGVAEFEKMSVNMYPNPSNNEVFIKSDGEFQYEILDLTGQLVKSASNLNGTEVLNVKDWSPGAYIVQINNGNATEILRLIVE